MAIDWTAEGIEAAKLSGDQPDIPVDRQIFYAVLATALRYEQKPGRGDYHRFAVSYEQTINERKQKQDS